MHVTKSAITCLFFPVQILAQILYIFAFLQELEFQRLHFGHDIYMLKIKLHCFNEKFFFQLASKPFNMLWIRSGSQPYLKIVVK